MKDESILYWIWLSLRCGVGTKDFRRLAEKYDDPFEIYRLEEEEIERLEGISPALKLKLMDRALDDAYAILKYCKQKKVDIIPYGHKLYPTRLKSIEDPPVLLYAAGKMPDMNDRLCVAMVGTRKFSEYGRDSAYSMAYELASAKAVVVSGMALGIDGIAACGALAAGGQTVAVLGSGISVVYPKEHKKLMESILKQGAVITEYPPFEPPHGYNFPKRNRIISGLCQGVIVIEGSSNSGSLITASRAVEQGREVFALPGNVGESNSEGPNELIKNGALVALSADDVIDHFDFLYHTCIDYGGLRKAKRDSMPVERALDKYGVSVGSHKRRVMLGKTEIHTEAKAEKIGKAAASVSENKPTEPIRQEADSSQKLLDGLDDNCRKVFSALPMDKAVSPDGFVVEDVAIGDVITALTMLEISGLIQSLPGGMYIRK